MLNGGPMTGASEKFRCAHGPTDITAVCFTAEDDTSLDLDPAIECEEAHYPIAKMRHFKEDWMQLQRTVRCYSLSRFLAHDHMCGEPWKSRRGENNNRTSTDTFG